MGLLIVHRFGVALPFAAVVAVTPPFPTLLLFGLFDASNFCCIDCTSDEGADPVFPLDVVLAPPRLDVLLTLEVVVALGVGAVLTDVLGFAALVGAPVVVTVFAGSALGIATALDEFVVFDLEIPAVVETPSLGDNGRFVST